MVKEIAVFKETRAKIMGSTSSLAVKPTGPKDMDVVDYMQQATRLFEEFSEFCSKRPAWTFLNKHIRLVPDRVISFDSLK